MLILSFNFHVTIFFCLFQMLQNWSEEATISDNAGWDAEEEDMTDVLKQHRRMKKMHSK